MKKVLALILALLLGVFEQINNVTKWVDTKVVEESVLVGPVKDVSDFVFPYLLEIKDAIVESDSFRLDTTPEATSDEAVPAQQI